MIITILKSSEIFVFGSNMAGIHGGGAARQAQQDFGAEHGVGEGLTGRCYAFPTLGSNFERLSISSLEDSRSKLYEACRANPEKRFLLTKVGCGIAGYDEAVMRALFTDPPVNLVLPEGW
jgi:hypothetical protein